jgi:hypothetical protein
MAVSEDGGVPASAKEVGTKLLTFESARIQASLVLA